MNPKRKRWSVLTTVSLVFAACLSAGGAEEWRELFKPDLSDAIAPTGVWHFADGVLTADKDQCIWTKPQYENFVLDLEFKNGEAANSGVFVYCTDVRNGKWVSNSVEIQILDDAAPRWAKVAPTWKCGGLFGRLAPGKSMVKPAGEWNRMTITCLGPRIKVELNGEVTADADMKQWTDPRKNPDGSDIPAWLRRPMAEMAAKGHIGLQGKHGGAPIYFRNLRIRTVE